MPNVLLILHNDFRCNSAVHIHNLANKLSSLGFDCIVAVPENKASVAALSEHQYRPVEFVECDHLEQLFANGQGPDIIHAWTPREIVRQCWQGIQRRYGGNLFVHLEDNEEFLAERFLAKSIDEIRQIDPEHFPQGLAHPRLYREFLAQAAGVTVIIDQLKEFVPEGVPILTLWPGVETSLFNQRDRDLDYARSIAVPLNATVLAYTGNVHAANASEVRSLYLAVAILNREGHPTVLVRAGRDYYSFLGDNDGWARKYSIELGYVDNRSIPRILALADILIQPGRPDRFNNYRFPSKLPEFFSIGRPIVLPATNVGLFTTHLQHAYVLPVADALHMAASIRHIRSDPQLAQQLAQGAIDFAAQHLSWQRNAEKLQQFYLAPQEC